MQAHFGVNDDSKIHLTIEITNKTEEEIMRTWLESGTGSVGILSLTYDIVSRGDKYPDRWMDVEFLKKQTK